MKPLLYALTILLLMLAGCAPKPFPPVAVAVSERAIDYTKEVRPILDRRCVVCHSCYNAPCQLKLSAYEGLERGASKTAVYDSERLTAVHPTRLFVDADSAEQWHEDYGFFSVTASSASGRFNDSTLISLLEAKRRLPHMAGEYRPENDELTCPKDHDELEEYLDEYPDRGMPYGFPPLTTAEYTTLSQWIQQGARGPGSEEQAATERPVRPDTALLEAWERFLNLPDAKHALTARYLYEHLYLAHIRFGTPEGTFYELVRSKTAAPAPVEIIPTLRSYDDPGKAPFYYRFRRITSTLVHKTHMVFTLDEHQLTKVIRSFIDTPWLETPHVMGYGAKASANPFVTYAQIPASVRYGFLLDNSEYIVRTFIRGPVCKGQVALNVINDHFWVMFLDPKYDLSLQYPNLLRFNEKELSVPDERGSDFPAYRFFSDRYIERAVDYYKARADFYSLIYTDGLGYDAIWKGTEADDAPLLTVYRHFDSASVHKGVLGDLPKTLWVIDYPLFERIYYALVAGFDVFGNVGHQTNVRRYMDRLRVEGESNYIDFMPVDVRGKLFDAWNKNLNILVEEKLFYRPARMPSAIVYQTDDPKREFIEHLVDHELPATTGIGFDALNYFRAGEAHPGLPEHYRTREDYIQAFRAVEKPGTAFIRTVNGQQSNLAYVRVRMPEGEEDIVFSVIINRWHDNVAFLFDEQSQLDPSKDQANFIFDFVGSYPNMLLELDVDEAPAFFDMLQHYEDTPEYRRRFFHFGITRDNPRFWEAYDWFQKRFEAMHPIDAGLFDLNRYYYLSLPHGAAAAGE
ncbi:fatty acid cis/trans isomerase [Sulfurimonas sp. HSL1-2]|uniref:fatty acid cis/trans isomerase n=1 Tax=Thiomicrolovo zhangzhouensis TaxID=3131933 RepID=UPI0031F895BC